MEDSINYHNGYIPIYLKGKDLSAKELEERLKRMDINIGKNRNKDILVKKYDNAIEDEEIRKKILDLLEKDKQILNIKQKQRTNLPYNMNDSEEMLYNKRNEINQKMVIKGGEVMDENQLKNRINNNNSLNPNIQKGSTNALKDEEEDKEKNNSRINAFEHNRQNKIIQKENKNANNSLNLRVHNSSNILNNQNKPSYNSRMYIEFEDQNKSKLRIFILLILGAFLIYYIIKEILHSSNEVSEMFGLGLFLASVESSIFAFFSSIFLPILFGFLMVCLPLIIICYLFNRWRRNRKIRKLSKKIFQEIKKILEIRMDKSMSENEIIQYFSRKYNIDKEFFVKRYLVKELLKLCEKDKSIKFFTDSENGNLFWELRK